MPKLNERGVIAQVLVLLLLAAGLIGGLFLVQHPTFFKPKASELKPASAETSFTLKQESCGTGFWGFKGTCPKDNIKVSLYARSDIDAANLFAAKLKFPTDLLEVVSIDINRNRVRVKCPPAPDCQGGTLIHGDPTGPDDPNQCPIYYCEDKHPDDKMCPQIITKACEKNNPDNCQDFTTPCDVPVDWTLSLPIAMPVSGSSDIIGMADPASVYDNNSNFIKNWLEQSYDNDSGTISLVGGIPDPGYQSNLNQESQLMASIVFKAKKEGQGKITFGDDSAIYSNRDNINILTIKRDLDIDTSAPKPTPSPMCEKLASPTNLQPTNGTNLPGIAPVVLKWDSVKNITRYSIFIDDLSNGYSDKCDKQNPGDICEANLSGNQYIFTPQIGHKYTWWVASVNDNCLSSATSVKNSLLVSSEVCKSDADCPSGYFCPVCKSVPGAVCSTPTCQPKVDGGDLNGDTKTDLVDASTFFSKCAKKGVYNQPASAAPICDLNKDGKINAFDLATLLRILVANGSIKGSKVPQTIP